MELNASKKIYFASDFHLGAPNYHESREREIRIITWLEKVKYDAQVIYLLGDIFDFWFEYKTVVPKGYVRLLGKLAELCDSGIKIYLITGNHDLWMSDYFENEIGIKIYNNPITIDINNKIFYMAHGDGLNSKEISFTLIKKIFTNSFAQWLFAKIHPNIGISFANFWSRKSRIANIKRGEGFKGEDKEESVIFAKQLLLNQHYDFILLGHRHVPLDINLNNNSRYLNLGDWINHNSYAVFDGEVLELKYFICP